MRSFVTFLSIFALCQARPQARSHGALRPSLMKGGDQFIAGGTDAAPGEFPWQLSVQRQSLSWSHSFGASLLSANYALTAAHGVDGSLPSSMRVVAGLHQESDLTGAQIIPLSGYSMHESYGVGVGTFPNDIAILNFATPVVISGTVQPATLPVDGSNSYDGYMCVITGWGTTGIAGEDALQKASIEVLSTIECSSFMDSVPESRVTESQICVYDPAHVVGVCGGDTGGPLNCPDGATLVVGVGSWIMADGGDNCQQQSPSVYTRVSSYLGWIAANTP